MLSIRTAREHSLHSRAERLVGPEAKEQLPEGCWRKRKGDRDPILGKHVHCGTPSFRFSLSISLLPTPEGIIAKGPRRHAQPRDLQENALSKGERTTVEKLEDRLVVLCSVISFSHSESFDRFASHFSGGLAAP